MASESIRRIGREPTVKEKSYQFVVENAHVLDHVACNLFGHETEMIGMAKQAAWDALSDEERDTWKQRAIAQLKDFVEEP